VIKNSFPLNTGPIIFPETSVGIYRYPPRNDPEERSSLLPGRSLKSRRFTALFYALYLRQLFMRCILISYTVGAGSFPGMTLPAGGVDNPPPSRAKFEETEEL